MFLVAIWHLSGKWVISWITPHIMPFFFPPSLPLDHSPPLFPQLKRHFLICFLLGIFNFFNMEFLGAWVIFLNFFSWWDIKFDQCIIIILLSTFIVNYFIQIYRKIMDWRVPVKKITIKVFSNQFCQNWIDWIRIGQGIWAKKLVHPQNALDLNFYTFHLKWKLYSFNNTLKSMYIYF